MKAFACVVLLAAAALAAPEGKRDKRGFLHSDIIAHDYAHDFGYHAHDFGHHAHDFGHFDSLSLAHSDLHLHAPVYHAPAAKIVSVNKVVEIPKVVEVKKIVSVPKVVSVPQVVKVSKIVEDHHPIAFAPSYSAGWW